MAIFQTIVTYFFLFITLYVEIFMLTIFLLQRKEIKRERSQSYILSHYPTVTITVPCYNEEKTIQKTLESLLALEYPKEKLSIVAIDDGSTDQTWNILQHYAALHPEIKIIHKENGGKYTALNLSIAQSTSEFIGCLDADSFVHPQTLKKIMKRFEERPETMAVTPALCIYSPRTVVQFVQTAEYYMGVLAKKVQSFLGAIHVTPGPFTIFRREVFEKIGPFKRAHNLEDMEMAFRMQKNHLKIDNVHHAWVYTVGPRTFKKLYRQRLRWTSGFLENAKDYRDMFFNPQYGNVSILTLPTALFFVFAVIFTVFFFFWRIGRFLFHKYLQWRMVGFLVPHFTLSWFYVSTKLYIFLSGAIFLLTLFLLINAQKLVEGKYTMSRHIILFFLLYPLMAPFWILKSIYNSAFARTISWS